MDLKINYLTSLVESLVGGRRILPPQQQDDEDLNVIPLDSVEALENLEERLLSNGLKQRMINMLSLSGGHTMKKTIWRIASKVFTPNLAKSLNWCGRGDKRGLKQTACGQVIIEKFEFKVILSSHEAGHCRAPRGTQDPLGASGGSANSGVLWQMPIKLYGAGLAFVLENQLQGKVTPTYVKKKWENLKQKYKVSFVCCTEGGEATAASWKWYADMDEAIGGRPSISPPTLISSSGQDAAEASPSSRSMETPAKKRRGVKDLVEYLREMEERENEREIEAAKNEERRWREAEEREERRERERIEREEKREQETHQREEKREPVVRKNIILAKVVEDLKKRESQDPLPSGPEDVECDYCTERKSKAVKSCLVCLASFCETHLQPHYRIPAYKKHKLVEASRRLQDQICSQHDKLLEVYCRTDQQCICLMCTMDDHKGHDTISAAAERTEKHKQLLEIQRKFKKKIQNREKELCELINAVKSHKCSARTAVENIERICTELI
ncbi:uncharacterized protein LOC134326151, partial [Trichomycterus rosablanca]|uniref:uncharacterized protein LOC134326151 n=1 Tax=Trichomycterus rosablanca TaxID=2290929 RepID=UPI002F353DAD